MSFDQDFPVPDDELAPLPPARRRRARRSLIPTSNDERSAVLENLARKAFPSFEFFLFSLLLGGILGAGYIFDSQGILLLGVLIAPLMAPWVGICLATVTGSGRFFFQTLIALTISAGLVFGSSYLAGIAAQILPPETFLQATIHTHLWWANLLVLVLGSILLIISFVRSEQWPILPSVMLSYGLFLPLSAAGFGLGSGNSDFWSNGILVFCAHLSLATLVGLVTLFFLGFRPRRLLGWLFSLILGLLTLATVVWLTGIGPVLLERFNIPQRILTTQAEATFTPRIQTSPTSTATLIALVNEPTQTPTLQIPVTATPTSTYTPNPTPVYARILSPSGLGANVRVSPGGDTIILVSLVNDTLIEILPEIQILDNITWLHIRTADNIEGWIIQSLVVTATPAPGW